MENNAGQNISREALDIERTKMALERTYLSYIRTALTVLVAGVSLIQFFNNITFRTIGVILVPVSVLIFFVGSLRIYQKKKKLRTMAKKLISSDSAHI